jgi:hypothetical protein
MDAFIIPLLITDYSIHSSNRNLSMDPAEGRPPKMAKRATKVAAPPREPTRREKAAVAAPPREPTRREKAVVAAHAQRKEIEQRDAERAASSKARQVETDARNKVYRERIRAENELQRKAEAADEMARGKALRERMEEIDAEHELLRKEEKRQAFVSPHVRSQGAGRNSPAYAPTFDSPKSKVSSTSPDFGPGSPKHRPGWCDRMLSQSDSDSE